MSRSNQSSPNTSAAKTDNETMRGKVKAFQSQDSQHKLNIVNQFIQHISYNEKIIEDLKNRLKVYQQGQRKILMQDKKVQQSRQSFQRAKRQDQEKIKKLNAQITSLKNESKKLKETIKSQEQNKSQVVKGDPFLERQSQNLQLTINLTNMSVMMKSLQQKCKRLQSQKQNTRNQNLQFFIKQVDKIKSDQEKFTKENEYKLQKLNSTVEQLKRQKENLKKENSSLQKQLNQALEKLKSNQLTSKLVKCITNFGQKQTEFEKKVSMIKDDQLENRISEKKEFFQQGIISIVKNVFGSNKANKKQKQDLQASLKRFQRQNTQLRQELRKCQQDLNKVSLDLKKTQSNLLQKSSDHDKSNKLNQKLNITIGNKQTQIAGLKQNSAKLNRQIEVERKINQQAAKDIKQKDQSISKLTIANGKLNTHIETLKKQIYIKDGQIANFKSRINSNQMTIRNLNNNIADLKQTIQILQGQLQAHKIKVRQQENLIVSLKSKIADLQKRIKQLDQKSRNSQDNNQKLIIQKKKFKEQLQISIKGFKDLSKTYNKCLIEPITYVFMNRVIRVQQPKFDRVADIERDLQQIGDGLRSSFRASKYFNNSTVLNETQIDFLVQAIESYTKHTVQNSFLIYKYDTINPINFHNYIDRKQNLLLVIKLVNGYVIGGFSEYAIEKGRIEKPGSGFIFNCNIKKSYNVRSDARLPVVSYDDYFCLFGNAEIRLKSQEAKVFSNFGIAASTFETGRDTRTKFLNIENPNDNQLDLESYEYYQITFKR